MPQATIYHNPRCSKSRQTLSMLEEKQIELEVIEYLKDPPTEETILNIVEKLGIEPMALIRSKEYEELRLPPTDDTNEIAARMAANPQIIQRPIVVVGDQARLGRPPENVLEIL